MDYLRVVDQVAFDATEARVSQKLLNRASGSTSVEVNCNKTPPGGGSSAGLHTHDVDQIFYILEGTMSVEIDGKSHEAHAGTLVFFPAHVPHRNWNGSEQRTVHLQINAGLADPNVPFATRVP